jgi:PAS domain S-box-containing protein
MRRGDPDYALCAPDLKELSPELLFTLVAENVRDYAVFLMDTHGVIRCWGEGARLMKWWSRQQAEGAHLRFLYPDGGSEDGTAERHLEEAASTGEYTGEGHRVRSDGSLFWAGVTLTALRNTEGKLVGFAKVTRDFSARRAVEAALMGHGTLAQDLQRAAEEVTRLKMFVAAISHEVRAPLNAMLGSADLLEREIGGPERQRVHLERLQRSGRHLLQIMTDVLDVSRAEAGALPVTPVVSRLGPAIHDAVAEVEQLAEESRVTILNSTSGSAADVPYWGDQTRVRQIIVNLLTNAIKFSEPGRRITISGGTGERVTGDPLQARGPLAYVRVEDEGRGIPQDRLQPIFEPYQQSDDADQHQGAGLGLSISRQLARAMGGDLTVQSEIGQGSTFTLWLPLAASDPVPR